VDQDVKYTSMKEFQKSLHMRLKTFTFKKKFVQPQILLEYKILRHSDEDVLEEDDEYKTKEEDPELLLETTQSLSGRDEQASVTNSDRSRIKRHAHDEALAKIIHSSPSPYITKVIMK